MDDLISREQAFEEIKSVFEWHDVVTVDRLVEHIKRLPSAQKKGHWQKYEGRFDYDWECSECGCSSYEKTDWCAHCGAKMVGEEDGCDK